MRKITLTVVSFLFLSSYALAEFDYVSVAHCTPEVQRELKSLELFYDDEDAGLLVTEVVDSGFVVRGAFKAKVKATASVLEVTFLKNKSFTINRSTEGTPSTITLDERKYTCNRAEW